MTTPRKCEVLPPMAARQHEVVTNRPDAEGTDTRKRRSAGRFGVLNRFADQGARLTDTTAQACWWILYRETKPDGLATVSHQRIAECVGVDRKTVTRALKRLERVRLMTVVRHGGWRLGPSTYRIHATPKRSSKSEGSGIPSTTHEH